MTLDYKLCIVNSIVFPSSASLLIWMSGHSLAHSLRKSNLKNVPRQCSPRNVSDKGFLKIFQSFNSLWIRSKSNSDGIHLQYNLMLFIRTCRNYWKTFQKFSIFPKSVHQSNVEMVERVANFTENGVKQKAYAKYLIPLVFF